MVVGPAERLRCPPPEIIRAPNTPVPVGPVFGFTGELNPATRVTAEAAMEGPSPPFFSGRQFIHFCKSLGKKWCYKERRYGAMQPQQEGCLELIPGRTGVVTEMVTGPRKWEIRS